MKTIIDKIKITSHQTLTAHLVERLLVLEKSCLDYDGTVLKLELDYKLASAHEAPSLSETNCEFFAWFGERLVGYIGISNFSGLTMEVNGMVEPDFRKHGIFTSLFECVKEAWLKQSKPSMLLLTDRHSIAGHAFMKKIGAVQVEAMNDTALNLYLSCGFVMMSTMDYFEFK